MKHRQSDQEILYRWEGPVESDRARELEEHWAPSVHYGAKAPPHDFFDPRGTRPWGYNTFWRQGFYESVPGSTPAENRGLRHHRHWHRHHPGMSHTNYFGMGPKGHRRSDESVQEDVYECLTYQDEVDATLVDVQVANGLVTLRGKVESKQARRKIEEMIEDIYGVRDVRNELDVQNPLPPSS